MKGLYDKSFKALETEIEEDIRRWKDLLCSWITRIHIIKMAIPSKEMYSFDTILTKIPIQFYIELEMTTLNFIRERGEKGSKCQGM